MLTVENGEIVEEYDEFVDIGENLESKITDLTGITNEMLINQGVYEDVIAEDLKERLTPDTYMIAHNAQFDLAFVYHLLRRHYPEKEVDEIVEKVKWIDTLTILKDRKDYPHKLIDAVKHYELEDVNYHRAIDDTKALYQVTLAMKAERDDLKYYKKIFGYNPKWGRPREEFEFIEYKSQPYHNRGFLPIDDTLYNK